MSFEKIVALVFGVVIVLVIIGLAVKFMPKRLKQDRFAKKWKTLQDRCSDQAQWPLAIIEADTLLDEALKKKRYKGKSMGERLVEAQKKFTNNDAVWFGHKLRMKVESEPEFPLTQKDVQKALVGLRQGLKDIGAL